MSIHDAIIELMDRQRNASELKPTELWQIHFRGRAVGLSNGKSVWKKIGHAKLALQHDMMGLWYGVGSVAKNSREVSAALRDLEARGDIVYVRVV